jgi:hypothetical protein
MSNDFVEFRGVSLPRRMVLANRSRGATRRRRNSIFCAFGWDQKSSVHADDTSGHALRTRNESIGTRVSMARQLSERGDQYVEARIE